jgi:hypothetical protein
VLLISVTLSSCQQSTNPSDDLAQRTVPSIVTFRPPVQVAYPPSQHGLECTWPDANMWHTLIGTNRHEAPFWLTNKMREDIIIDEIRISCECLTLSVPARAIQPGETIAGLIDIVIDESIEGPLANAYALDASHNSLFAVSITKGASRPR